MTAKLCQVAFGDPTRDGATPTPQDKLSMVRTMASWRGTYNRFASEHPDIHLSETIQLGEVISDPRLEDVTTFRNLISRMVEGHGLRRVTLEEMGYAGWAWGMDAVHLGDTRRLDQYFNYVGHVIGAQNSGEPIQSVSLDTCAWTIEEKYRFLGGSARTIEDRKAWIDDRLQAFIDGYCAGGARVPLMVNGGRGAIDKGLIARTVDTGVYYEAWGLNSYSERWGGRTPYDALVYQMQQAFEYLDNRPRQSACIVLNPVPYNWEQEKLIEWLRGAAVLWKVVEAKANARRVPIYWHTDRTHGYGNLQSTEIDITQYPIVMGILNGQWDVHPPQFTPDNFAEIARTLEDGSRLVLTASVDELTGFALAREKVWGQNGETSS